jgi:hypothetical protein
MSDRISVLNDKDYVNALFMANCKTEFALKYPQYSPRTLSGKVVKKPINGRDSIGVSVETDYMFQEYVEGDEGVVCCFMKDGVVSSITAKIELTEQILSTKVKSQDGEIVIQGCENMKGICENIYEDIGISRMARFDVKGDKVLEVNYLGGIGKGGLMWRAFDVNGYSYSDFLRLCFSHVFADKQLEGAKC